jgi:antirestriction protein ArdC
MVGRNDRNVQDDNQKALGEEELAVPLVCGYYVFAVDEI